MKLRVLHVIETLGIGGVERTRLSIAKHIAKDKFELKIVCTKTVGNLVELIRNEGVEIHEIGKMNYPFSIEQHLKVQRIIKDYQPHIIHGAVFEGVTLAALNGWLMGTPIIILEETSDPQNRSWRGNLLMKLFVSISTKTIGVSEASLDYLRKKLRFSEDKTILINNGVEIPSIASFTEVEFIRTSLGITDSSIVIGSVGRMDQDNHKRFSDLIRAFALLIDRKINAKLVLVGDGKVKQKYELLVQELGIDNDVKFVGSKINTSPYYDLFDVFALLSGMEAFGLVFAEAMFHKLPVLGTNVGGIPYVVEDGVTGYLVSPFNPEDAADKLELLCKDEKLRFEFGKNGYDKAINQFSATNYVNKIESLYVRLAKLKSINFE